MTKRAHSRTPFAPELLESKISPVGVPVTLTTAAIVFVPVSMAITNTVPATNDWTPPLDTSDVPLVPGGPG